MGFPFPLSYMVLFNGFQPTELGLIRRLRKRLVWGGGGGGVRRYYLSGPEGDRPLTIIRVCVLKGKKRRDHSDA